ncbi:MAG TPA: YhcH/YjgK/YiaL family protein [Aminobacterium sp.]|uniref:YhcH/YjgK/YiaL family protein n=1 Tax=Aminobacterium TaxID=81466 RepID=UPI000ECF2838|nr:MULTISPECIES: YhcH/YjgK/YiaL family protein [Aminobacterium]HCA40282.1 YhcH/YjgK/YiaL family protein [Aminobacterium sp.]
MKLIFDTLGNASTYYCMGERIRRAFEFLKTFDPSAMEDGKYEIEGSSVFAILQSATTKPKEAQVWEAHCKYIDIQCLLSGQEWLGYAPLESMHLVLPYDEIRDFALYDGHEGLYFQNYPGRFVIFYPQDVHKGCVSCREPSYIRKIVIKVQL